MSVLPCFYVDIAGRFSWDVLGIIVWSIGLSFGMFRMELGHGSVVNMSDLKILVGTAGAVGDKAVVRDLRYADEV